MIPVLIQEPLWVDKAFLVLLYGVPWQKKARKGERQQRDCQGQQVGDSRLLHIKRGLFGVSERDCAEVLSHVEEEKMPQGSTTAQARTFAVESLLLGDMENQLLWLQPGYSQGQSLSHSCSSFSSSCPRSCFGG